jgi:hypothetical protein
MNEELFYRALTHVDIAYVEECMEERCREIKRRVLSATWQKVLAAAACFAVIISICGAVGVFHLWGNSPGADDPQDPTHNYPQTRIYSGPSDNSKPMPSQRIIMETFSYYRSGDTVTVDAGMGDEYAKHQQYGQTPTYDTYGVNGYPVFLVYEIDDENPGTHLIYRESDVGCYGIKEGSGLIISGAAARVYERRLTEEDMASLDLHSYDANGRWTPAEHDQYHWEAVTLDFSRLEPGDHGSVAFLFGWYFEHDNPYTIDKSKPSIAGYLRELSYYVGEDGVGLSFNSWLDAKNAYHQTTSSSSETGSYPYHN